MAPGRGEAQRQRKGDHAPEDNEHNARPHPSHRCSPGRRPRFFESAGQRASRCAKSGRSPLKYGEAENLREDAEEPRPAQVGDPGRS